MLAREKLQRYLSPEDREEFLEALIERGRLVEPEEVITACRDPRDDKVLELAVAGGALCIITGDGDLLDIRSFRGVDILTAKEFLAAEPGRSPAPADP